MERIVPWGELCEFIAPVYPVAGKGRPPRELEMVLRIYFLQQWFNLCDPGAEDAFVTTRCRCAASWAWTLARARRWTRRPSAAFVMCWRETTLARPCSHTCSKHLEHHGIKVGKSTIVDASIISAPPSTKNKDRARDPEIHQTKKGKQWYFGMKAHIGVDSRTKVIHAVAASAANVHDATCLRQLLHGEETEVWGDSAYQGQGALIARHAPNARDMTHRRYRRKGVVDERERAENRAKSSGRAKVEHPFLVIKRIFGFAKTRYRGLQKNANRLFVACALTNLYLMRRRLLRAT